MLDVHSEMHTFYRQHVFMEKTEREQLADYREQNIRRLKNGLKKLGYNAPIRTPTQGGYATHTLTQWPENNPDVDHDIDTATIFRREDLPESPLKARKRVLDGIIEGGGNFKRDPEARTNAVTVWYQEGYHVDLAVHRTFADDSEQKIIEHAGTTWSPRDPMDITNWSNNLVNTYSPSNEEGATVESGQMRRIVQLLKYFSKSRSSWNLPGGLIISVLVSECYCSDDHRDDQALYRTMESIRRRLQSNLAVYNPVDSSQELTYKDEYINQVSSLNDKLSDAARWLSPLFENDCTREDALSAWYKVFKHSYWTDLAEKIEAEKAKGERLRAARDAGSLFVSQTGQLSTSKREGKSVRVPEHRFHGGDEW